VGVVGKPEWHRNEALCSVAILPGAPDVTAVLDATTDDTYRTHMSVLGPPYLRFYAGAPIKVTYEGKQYKLGMVCVTSTEPRTIFDLRDKQFLLDMAAIVADEIELFRGQSQRIMEENQRYITCTAHDFRTPLQVFRLSVELIKEHFKKQQEDLEGAEGLPSTTTASQDIQGSNHSMRGAKPKCVPLLKNTEKSSEDSCLKKRDPTIKEFFFAEAQISLSSTALRSAAKTTEMMDVVVQAECACDMMSETVRSAIEAARARWTRVKNYISSSGRGFLSACKTRTGGLVQQQLVELDVATLVTDCRRLSTWHHCESIGWIEEIAPEVIDVLLYIRMFKRNKSRFLKFICKQFTSLN
jgi:hypothetical protein